MAELSPQLTPAEVQERIEIHLAKYLELTEHSSDLELRLYAVREILFSLASKYGHHDADGRYRFLEGQKYDVMVNPKSTTHAIYVRRHDAPETKQENECPTRS